MEILKEELVTFAEVRRILEAKSKDKELGYEQNNALEYLKKFSRLSGKATEELLEALAKIEKLKDRHKILIVNFLPEDVNDLRVLLAHEVVSLSEDDKKAIIAAVKNVL